eukprot:gnl/Spiro4/11680_TR6162_c0_g1_i1.p1 gnl/Spiro4/11680_TR6162_c0_g1~~gnl/Spiro4/11680_TR6162_c0_g1_i1.p1  ORF type:complete len:243 (+),score=27.47 gnl/Spiro4/11680_TR6162_c0_g1_i1:111-731(+)
MPASPLSFSFLSCVVRQRHHLWAVLFFVLVLAGVLGVARGIKPCRYRCDLPVIQNAETRPSAKDADPRWFYMIEAPDQLGCELIRSYVTDQINHHFHTPKSALTGHYICVLQTDKDNPPDVRPGQGITEVYTKQHKPMYLHVSGLTNSDVIAFPKSGGHPDPGALELHDRPDGVDPGVWKRMTPEKRRALRKEVDRLRAEGELDWL